MMPFLTESYGNPGSLHQKGREAESAVEHAREQVAEFMGAQSPEQIVFTSGGTEGNNLVFSGMRHALRADGRPFDLVSNIEHDSVLRAAEKNCLVGFCGKIQADHSGIVTEDAVKTEMGEYLPSRIGLVSVMSANNELGTINPVSGICDAVHDSGALFHTDAVQAAGLYPLKVFENGYDFVTVSSHKIHGPKGMGALYVRNPEPLRPLIVGGSHQEFGLRGGTENVAGIVGFGKACELANQSYEVRAQHRRLLTFTLIRDLGLALGAEQYAINGKPQTGAKTISLRFDGIDAQTLLLMLDSRGVCVSAGSACTAHEDTPSHVLTAIGLSPEQARSTIRISFSDDTTMEEVAQGAAVIAECVLAIRKIQNSIPKVPLFSSAYGL